jgi:hypothetical protein
LLFLLVFDILPDFSEGANASVYKQVNLGHGIGPKLFSTIKATMKPQCQQKAGEGFRVKAEGRVGSKSTSPDLSTT